MKLSNYNITSEISNKELILSNLLSGAIISINKESYYLIQNNREDEISSSLLNKLKIGRFLIPDNFDELNFIQTKFFYNKFRTDLLSLTILPTLDCNFDCSYCYENNTISYMSEEIANKLVNFTARNLAGKKDFSVAWYGGEPLLAASKIWDLSKVFIAMSKKIGVRYDASMITNGALLTPENVHKLIEHKIQTIQVTIDGPRDIHNKMRPFSSRFSKIPDSYDLILDNVAYACEKIAVNIRINLGQDNYEQLEKLLNSSKFNKLKDRVNIYISPLLPFGTGSKVNDHNFHTKCFDHPSFANIEANLSDKIKKAGFEAGYDFDGSKCSCCRAVCLNHWVVDPEGNLLKCWDSLGDSTGIVGHISEPPKEEPMFQNHNLFQWISYSPLNNIDCKQCKFLPLCMGGCPHRVIKDKVDNKFKCSFIKFNYKQMLKSLYLESQKI
ncbi:MAG: SPASM domain-containing protein [Halanaerobiales bacterium]|nr:SPASM domain-containing protein [Halanaerobiales bacterium]